MCRSAKRLIWPDQLSSDKLNMIQLIITALIASSRAKHLLNSLYTTLMSANTGVYTCVRDGVHAIATAVCWWVPVVNRNYLLFCRQFYFFVRGYFYRVAWHLLPCARAPLCDSGNTIFPWLSSFLSKLRQDMSFRSPDGNRQSHSSHNFMDKRLMLIPGFSPIINLIWFSSLSPSRGLDVAIIIALLALALV